MLNEAELEQDSQLSGNSFLHKKIVEFSLLCVNQEASDSLVAKVKNLFEVVLAFFIKCLLN
jgi:hypothetical protein